MKPHITIEQQIELLVSRGLIVTDEARFADDLVQHNYYRLRGYFHPFLLEHSGTPKKIFKPYVSDTNIMDLVRFDQKLRNLLYEALAVFELRFRAVVAYHAGSMHPHIHLNGVGLTPEFKQQFDSGSSGHDLWLSKYSASVDKHKNADFVKWHLEKYDGRLPVWAAVEILDFGQVAKLFRSLDERIMTPIAKEFGQTATFMKGLVASLNDLRNHVSHHSRIWNNHFVYSPPASLAKLPLELHHIHYLTENERHKLFTRLSLLIWLDSKRNFEVNFQSRLFEHIRSLPKHHSLDSISMGDAPAFETSELWQGFYS